MAASTGAAGAGLKIVVTPWRRAISRPRRAAAIGCSSWVMNTFEAAMVASAFSTIAGVIEAAAPLSTMMALSPDSDETKMKAAPVGLS